MAVVPEEPKPPLLDIAVLIVLYGVGFVAGCAALCGLILAVAALL